MGMFDKIRKNQAMISVPVGGAARRPAGQAPRAAIPPAGAQETSPEDRNIFAKCPACNAVLFTEDITENQMVCPRCQHHLRLSARQRLGYTVDEGSFVEMDAELAGNDPLQFPGYADKLRAARAYTGLTEAVVTGYATIQGEPVMIAVMDGNFMMGSMGAAVGEKITRCVEEATRRRLPVVIFTVSGGARMQEGLVSLMQMTKTSAALGRHGEAGLLYITVLTDPTTGGVTASFAMRGDIILAEPGALVGFAGKRVIEQTVKQSLPEGFQREEFVMDKGFVDAIVPRRELPGRLGQLLRLHHQEVRHG